MIVYTDEELQPAGETRVGHIPFAAYNLRPENPDGHLPVRPGRSRRAAFSLVECVPIVFRVDSPVPLLLPQPGSFTADRELRFGLCASHRVCGGWAFFKFAADAVPGVFPADRFAGL